MVYYKVKLFYWKWTNQNSFTRFGWKQWVISQGFECLLYMQKTVQHMEAFSVVMVEQIEMEGYSPLLFPVKKTKVGEESSP